jgi:hypothetical protein
MTGGFKLDVTYDVAVVITDAANTATFGLIRDVSSSAVVDGAFVKDVNNTGGIGLSLTEVTYDTINMQGLNQIGTDGSI